MKPFTSLPAWLRPAACALQVLVCGACYGSTTIIETLQVTDGFAIQEVPEGVVFEQELTEDCELVPDGSGAFERPLAGRISKTITVRAALATCPAEPATAPVGCSWAWKPAAGNPCPQQMAGKQEPWTGASGLIEIPMPACTGTYELSLTCEIEGSGKTHVERMLFATYGPPQIDEEAGPKTDWYRRACEWGAGFDGAAAEDEILKTLLHRLHHYGRNNWRYGSFVQSADTGSEQGGYPPVCLGGWCACPWYALVAQDTECNYGSCQQFSEVFSHVAATLGIGLVEVTGIESALTTRPGALSLDAKFATNVACGADAGKCPAYAFSRHILAGRDGRHYDPTFNKVYGKDFENEIVLHKIGKPVGDKYLELVGEESILCYVGKKYGGWSYFFFPDVQTASTDPAELCPKDRAHTASLKGRSADFEGVDEDGDGYYEALAIDVRVEVEAAGSYQVSGSLWSGDDLVSNRPSSHSERFTSAVVPGEPGRHSVRLYFSGEDVAALEGWSSLEARVALVGEQGVIEAVTYTSPDPSPVNPDAYGEKPAVIERIRPAWIPPNPGDTFDALRATVAIDARIRGSVVLRTRLAAGGRSLAYGRLPFQMEPGKSTVDLEMADIDVRPAPDATGPLLLSVDIYDVARRTVIDSDTVDLEPPAIEAR